MLTQRRHILPLIVIAATVLTAITACSTKKNTAATRFWHSFNTKYNVYYNGQKHYDEQIKKLENDYEDDYSQTVLVHPAEAYSNPKATQPGTNFDRTIEKMQKAISLHSIKKKPKRKAGKGNDPKYKEWLKRDEYNPFIHNAWYLMAKAQYMKGDFLSSAATFHYIYRHFTWLPDLALESRVWEALSYCAMGWTTEADNVLNHIHPEKIEDSRIQTLANLAFADYYIKSNAHITAIPYLEKAVKGAKGGQKVRLNFLLGQLYAENNQNKLAYEAFRRAGSSSSSTYRTKFNARIKQSAVFDGTNVESEVRALKRMTRYDRNKPYLDQIYYAIGNLYLSKQDTAKAIESYETAAKKSTRNGIDKAISQLTLGGLYFAQHKYDKAQPCYSEAVPQLSENYPNYKALKHRSDVLDELAVYSQNVTLQDSLLKLSQMPLDEQKKVIKKIIDELKKKEKEEKEAAERENYLAQQQAQGTGLKNNTQQPAQFNLNADNSWYFYNTATKNAGKTAFQQQWGSRKLEDNWRRRNKNTFSLDDESDSSNADNDSTKIAAQGDSIAAGNDSTKLDKEAQKRLEDPHFEEYYLKQIPKTEEDIQKAHDVIQEGLYNMGVILKDKLEDLPAAAYEFERLLERYPDNIYRLDTYYNMYLLNKRRENEEDAEMYRQLILSGFADSKYGIAMKDPQYLENLKKMDAMQERMYERAYRAYLSNDNRAVHEAYAEMMRSYPLSKIMPKFMFIDALAYLTQKDYEHFKSTLKEMLERYPETDITPTASAIVKQLNQGRKPNSGDANLRGMSWSTTRLGNDSTVTNNEREFTPFKEGRNKPQLFILVFDTDSASANQLLYEVARHNFTSFVMQDFDLEPMTFRNLGLIVVKGFANFAAVKHYKGVWDNDGSLQMPSAVHQVIISQENFDLLLNEGRSFEDYFRYLEEQNIQDVEGLIPPHATDDAKRDDDTKASPADNGNVDEQQGDPEHPDDVTETGNDDDTGKKRSVRDRMPQNEQPDDEDDGKQQTATQRPDVTKPADTPDSGNNSDGNDKPETDIAGSSTQSTEVNVSEPEKPIVTTTTDEPKKPEVNTTATTGDDGGDSDKPAAKTARAQRSGDKNKAKAGNADNDDGKRSVRTNTKDEERKQREREEKAQRKAEQERQKQLKQEEKQRNDSIKAEQKRMEKELREQQKQHDDSVKQAQRDQEQAAKQLERDKEEQAKQREREKAEQEKQKAKDRENAEKQREQERKDKLKAKEDARKQREKERKERAKERERKKKEQEKAKKEAAKQRKEAAKQREKERKEAAKKRAEERKQARQK